MVVHYPRTVWKNSYAKHKVNGKTYNNKGNKPRKLSVSKSNNFIPKNNNSKKLSYKDGYELSILPEKISKLEKRLHLLEEDLKDTDLYHKDVKKFNAITTEITTIKQDLSVKEERWLQLQILNEEINS